MTFPDSQRLGRQARPAYSQANSAHEARSVHARQRTARPAAHPPSRPVAPSTTLVAAAHPHPWVPARLHAAPPLAPPLVVAVQAEPGPAACAQADAQPDLCRLKNHRHRPARPVHPSPAVSFPLEPRPTAYHRATKGPCQPPAFGVPGQSKALGRAHKLGLS